MLDDHCLLNYYWTKITKYVFLSLDREDGNGLPLLME